MYTAAMVDDLIDATANTAADKKLPDFVLKILTFSNDIVLDLLPYYITIKDGDDRKSNACLRLITEGLDQLRYNLDKKSPQAMETFNTIEDSLPTIFSNANAMGLSRLSAVLYESNLGFTLKSIGENSQLIHSDSTPDITPKLPELLEAIRREHRTRSAFDLYDGLMGQMQIMPIHVQLLTIGELLDSKKSMLREVAVILLLHPKPEMRQAITALLLQYVSKKIFTPLDLRRLITIRNWLLANERAAVDQLIKDIRLQGIMPAPFPPSKVNTIIASAFDGAGAQLILFNAKQGRDRVIGGFVLKCDIGIRDPWVNIKSPKGEFEHIRDNNELISKPVTMAYINKALKHFIATGQQAGNIPTPQLLQIAEILVATKWQPQPLNIAAELERLCTKIDTKITDSLIQISLERSGHWHRIEPFARYWFECGHVATDQMKAISENHFNSDTDDSFKESVIETLIQPILGKWKTIIIFMCLWARSKTIKKPLWLDLMILSQQLESGKTPLSHIPLINNIAGQSAASYFVHAPVES